MHQLLAQTLPVSEATVDKLLGANFLSLALIALVMVVGMFLLFVWMENRRQGREGRRQEAYEKRNDAVINAIVGERSPVVMAINNFTSAMRDNKQAQEDTNGNLIALSRDIKERSKLDGQAFDEMRDEVGKKIDENNEAVLKRITALEDGVNKLNTSVAGIQNCESFTSEITAMEARIMSAIREQAKRETATTQPANLIPDDGAKDAKEDAA